MIATQNLEVGEVKSQNLTLDNVKTQNADLLKNEPYYLYNYGVFGDNATQIGFTEQIEQLYLFSQVGNTSSSVSLSADNVDLTNLTELTKEITMTNQGSYTGTDGKTTVSLIVDGSVVHSKEYYANEQGTAVTTNLRDFEFDFSNYSGKHSISLRFTMQRTTGGAFLNTTITLKKVGIE